jgi:hypothetical protein
MSCVLGLESPVHEAWRTAADAAANKSRPLARSDTADGVIIRQDGSDAFIYSVNYDMKRLSSNKVAVARTSAQRKEQAMKKLRARQEINAQFGGSVFGEMV